VGRRNDILVTGNENEIYGHFTCDAEVEQFQWTRAQPPFSFLSLTAVDESSTFRDPFWPRFISDVVVVYSRGRPLDAPAAFIRTGGLSSAIFV
jgi:hypothetical protein